MKPYWALVAAVLIFVLTAMPFLPRLGIETDEAMLASGIYDHGDPWYSWKIGSAEIPVMLISYLGALKTWLYNPYFLIVHPGPVSLRIPNVLFGVAALWLFFALLRRLAGDMAASIGVLLLATDSMFLLIGATDFGFVALQFVLKLAALLLLWRFHRGGFRAALAGGFFLFGLGMWDKAVFSWVLFGLAAGAIVGFPRELRKYATARNLAIAALAMLAGASPLVIYNLARPLETFRANAHLGREPVFAKALFALHTMNGNALFGFLTAPGPGPRPGPVHWLASLNVRHNLILPALALSIAASVFRKRSAPQRFALAVCIATFLPMAFTAGAGGAVQHSILLWPFHLLILAATVAWLPLPWASAVTAALCLANLAVTNQYYADLVRNGPGVRWTDAIDPLNRYLNASKAERIFIADWGFMETLNLMNEGELPLYFGATADDAMAGRIVSSPRHLFVAHTPEMTFLPEIRAHLERQARQSGFEEEHLATISDRNGRPTFDVFRFRKIHL